MPHLNIEIKAKTSRSKEIRHILQELGAEFKGTDFQTDTYFNCPEGRLKLREGNIEHSLIFYRREDQAGPKASEVHLYHPQLGLGLKELVTGALGVWKEVKKSREIYFVGNVKFHLDHVESLGYFVEIEAIDEKGKLGEAYIRQQCEKYLELFEIESSDLLDKSYSDMIQS